MKTLLKTRIVPVTLFFLAFSLNLAAEDRIWTDSTGKFQIEAALVNYDGKEVRLRKKIDGKVVTLPVEKLSEEDVLYLKQLPAEEENPFAGGEEVAVSPFAGGEKDFSPETGRGSANAEPPVAVSYRNVPLLPPGTGENSWSITPDSLKTPMVDFKPVGMTLPYDNQELGVFVREELLFFSNVEAAKVLTGRWHKEKSGEVWNSRIYVGDLRTGKAVSFSMPFKAVPLGISPGGKRIMIRHDQKEGGWGERSLVEIHQLSAAGKLDRIGRFLPFTADSRDEHQKLEKDIDEGYWIGEDHVLLQSAATGDKRLVLLNIVTGKPVWTDVTFISRGVLAFSPNRKYFLLAKDNRVFLYETLTGNPVGQIADLSSGAVGGKLAIADDGKKLSLWDNNQMTLWNLATGQKVLSFTVIGWGSHQWLTPKYILAGEQVIDASLGCTIWKYTMRGPRNGTVWGGGYWYQVINRSTLQIQSVKIPHNSAIESFAKIPDNKRYAVQPGSAVSLVIEPSVDKDREKIEKGVREKILSYGWKITDSAPVRVVLSIKTEKEEKVSYGRFRFGGGNLEVTVTPRTSLMKIERDGKILWQSHVTRGAPGSINLDDLGGKSAQQVVNEQSGADYGWFTRVPIPKTIVDPDIIGQSVISGNGISQ
ncbi:MAG: hypothetical protein LBQ54_09690 [Planctomycetaceae bacterium]|nr:hypothetical protein [Planctomycetaceae bacterium]